ncbi:MAG: hypothetical protein KF727_14160 [Microbacteriaceae bacterium]|nr:hypothetical protein [Microbacteriaceae bacterium]
MTNAETTPRLRTYGNWTRPRTAGLLGLGAIGTGILLGGTAIAVIATIAGGLAAGFVVMGVVVLFLLLVSVRDRHGQSAFARIVTRVGWMNTRRKRNHIYRAGPLGRAEWGTAQLPGLVAGSRLTEWYDSYQRPFALLYLPSQGDYTVVLGTDPDGSSLVDTEQLDVWVAEWGMWLANAGEEPGLEAVSVTLETAPDTGLRLRRDVGLRVVDDAPTFSRELLEGIVDAYPAGSAVVKAYVALTFSAATRPGGKRRTPEEMGRELASRIPGLTQSLGATGAGAVRPVSAQQLTELVRIAYDPAAAVLIDEANAAGEPPKIPWPEVGPVATEARWDSYRHDSALSVTWMMSTAPRGNVPSSVLTRLLAPHRDIARKRVTLLYRPIPAGRAAAIVDADARAARFNLTSSNQPNARNIATTRAALATADEEASGAGLVNFGMLVTATVTDPTMTADARAAVDNLAATARLRLRPVYGSQDSAFSAALPLGLVLPKHLQVPTAVREQL